MFEEFIQPDQLLPEQLDEVLSLGWFRMGPSIFTTEFITFDQKIFRTLWLRLVLPTYQHSSTFRKLEKRNPDFRIECKPLQLDDRHHLLYRQYRQAMSFQMSPTINNLLYGWDQGSDSIFDTQQLELYEGDELVGCSFFDCGDQSAQGISSFYHPDYEKHSLGRYMIYLQIDFCKQLGMQFYYPGYFVPGYPHLDYKLKIGTRCLEFLHPHQNRWLPIGEYQDLGLPFPFTF